MFTLKVKILALPVHRNIFSEVIVMSLVGEEMKLNTLLRKFLSFSKLTLQRLKSWNLRPMWDKNQV